MKRIWRKFHQKHLEKRKLKFASWFDAKFPGKYCWADCVMWSMSSYRFNPFKIDSAKGCKTESEDHPTNMCYCGSWENGACWDLKPKEERDRILAERQKELNESPVDGLPF